MRARVLKRADHHMQVPFPACPPRAGTCVETIEIDNIVNGTSGARLVRARVLKPIISYLIVYQYRARLVRARVLKLPYLKLIDSSNKVPASCGHVC